MPVTVIKMSQISMTMIEGTVANWIKNEGDLLKKDEVLLEVETDKVVSEVTSPVTGILRKIIAQVGEDIPVGGDLCIIANENDDISGYISEGDRLIQEKTEDDDRIETTETNQIISTRKRISPLAKKIAIDKGINFNEIIGTGPDGLVKKDDVIKYSENIKETKSVAFNQEYEIMPFSGIRKVTAEQMMRGKHQTACLTTFTEVNMDKVKEIRKYIPVSYTTFVVKAASEAIKDFKIINSTLVENEIHIMNKINMNIAVGTGHSLVTPVIKNAGDKNILSISDDIDDLALRARENKLKNDDFSGGTFTVTNSGIYGSLIFTPIINYPQCAILGIGKLKKMPIVIEDEIKIATMCHLCLTYDHRIVDGETSVKFLQKVKCYLENPEEIIKKKK